MTTVGNLRRIATDGIVRCDSACRNENLTPESIAYGDLKAKRAKIQVIGAAAGTLADYVPFYFGPRSPMLYAIMRGNVAGADQRDIVYLVYCAQELAADAPFVITDGHAAAGFTAQYDTLAGLEEVDWPVMRGRMWNDTDADGDRCRRRQAEFLILGGVPLHEARVVAAMNDSTAQAASTALGGLAVGGSSVEPFGEALDGW